jgi:hypothetical protein
MWWFRMKDMILTLMMDLDVLYDLFIIFFSGRIPTAEMINRPGVRGTVAIIFGKNWSSWYRTNMVLKGSTSCD